LRLIQLLLLAFPSFMMPPLPFIYQLMNVGWEY
jgi:hypothetical protein